MSQPNQNFNEELGIGKQAEQETRFRMLNRDGTFNVRKTGLPFGARLDLYNALIMMTWLRFYALVLCSFIGLNVMFASVLWTLGPHTITHTEGANRYWEGFFFSVQTFATIGYGVLAPSSTGGNVMVVMISFTGTIYTALATGLLFARFSRPMARIMYSDKALISPFRDGRALMFRVTNMRKSQLIDVQARVILAQMVSNGNERVRRFFLLDIEVDKILFMPQHWTVVHIMDQNSPLYGVTMDDLKAHNSEILVLLSATDDGFSQTVHSRWSYEPDEIVCGGTFTSMFTEPINGRVTVDLRRLSDWQPAVLPHQELPATPPAPIV